MKLIRRIFGLVWAAFLLVSALGTVAAALAKRRVLVVDAPDADEVHLSAILAPIAFESSATAFRGGTIDTWYGGGIIDLRRAVLDPLGAHLRVRAIFGGAQLVVPEEWRVVSTVVGIGGVGDDRRTDQPEGAPTLTIEGRVLFGGFGVTSDVPESAVRNLRAAIARQAERGTGAARESVPQPATA